MSSVRELWRGGPTPEGLVVYTEGDCWALAYFVARLTGGHVVLIGGAEWWEHVAVRVAHNRYLDAGGLWSRQQILQNWRGPIFTLGYPAYSFNKYADRVKAELRFSYSARTAEAFARRLVTAELDERLAAGA